MKKRLLSPLKKILKFLAKETIKKYQPGVIAVTGSVGKTSTKEAIYTLLRDIRRTRSSRASFNNELGVPLTILGNWDGVRGLMFWPKVIWHGFWNLIFKKEYPEILILEYGADRPGDIKYLLDIAKPQISVVTAVGEMPVHVEFYSGPDAVADEKARLIEALPVIGFGILNYDDEAVLNMREKTRAHLITFGFRSGADVRITDFENRSEEMPNGTYRPAGISFRLEHGSNFIPIRLDGVFGRAQAYAVAAAACAGLAFGLNLTRIAESLQYYQAPAHRFKLLPGIKSTFILDDSYNASPLSMQAAIETVKDLRAKRKVAVLGDMLELGPYSPEAHENIGRIASRSLDILVTVGPRGKLMAAAAISEGIDRGRVFSFDTANQACTEVQSLIERGDLILVKASRAIQLDKIVEEIRAVPEST